LQRDAQRLHVARVAHLVVVEDGEPHEHAVCNRLVELGAGVELALGTKPGKAKANFVELVCFRKVNAPGRHHAQRCAI
jgi:hypothetical protein